MERARSAAGVNGVRIRAATIGDASEIAKLSTELGYPSTEDEVAWRLTALAASASHFIGVAERGGAVVGWIAAERRLLLESGERAEIVGLVVGASARRGGVGRVLVSAAEAWAAAQGLAVMTVRSNVARTESHPFYEAFGYVRQKTQHAYVKSIGDRPKE
jgi:GNAT superfamily N-acetyltransferase